MKDKKLELYPNSETQLETSPLIVVVSVEPNQQHRQIVLANDTIENEKVIKLNLIDRSPIDLLNYAYAWTNSKAYLITKEEFDLLTNANPDLLLTLQQVIGAAINGSMVESLELTTFNDDIEAGIYAWAFTNASRYAISKDEYEMIIQANPELVI